MTHAETNTWKEIQIEWCRKALSRLFRNQRYKGPIVAKGKITNGWSDCGVGGDGGSDLVGWHSITITPDMVGKTVAVFSAIETKTKNGAMRDEQMNFIRIVKEAGGISGRAENVEDARKLIVDYLQDKRGRGND